MRSVTQRGLDAIIRHEGVRKNAYRDVAGLLTIGVGHLLTRSELSSGKLRIGIDVVRWDKGITDSQCRVLLEQDLDVAEAAVSRDDRGLTDAQFDALVSFVFNVGVTAYENSTLRRKLLAGDLDAVPAQMRRWNRAGGVVVPGLMRRRMEEASLWAA
jgi:lysozyme